MPLTWNIFIHVSVSLLVPGRYQHVTVATNEAEEERKFFQVSTEEQKNRKILKYRL